MGFSEPKLQDRNTSIRFPDAPPAIRALPTDERGFPVPYFVEWIDGAPDFRVADAHKLIGCIRQNQCWICGRLMGRLKAFVIGPMCAVNRISSEPPSHPVCAVFAAQACPFLTRPLAKRPDASDLEAAGAQIAGMPLMHNPGVALVWGSLRYGLVHTGNGMLFDIGKPERAQWFREGRAATRNEVLEAFDKGLPFLRDAARAESPEAMAELEARLEQAMKLLPH